MVDSRKLGHDIDGAVATGRDNAAIRADVEGWCEHLAVETLGVSMVGHMAGVPIGPHRLSCQYAKYSTESHVLRSLFQRFITENCAGCAHHQPGPRVQFGRDYLTAVQENDARTREAESKRHQEIERLRQELIELANQRSATAQVEAASVFRLTADLFAETDANANATQMLCETCEVAPELFDDKVVALLELGVSDEIFAVKCLPVLACLARKAPEIRDRVRPCVIDACRLDLPVEMIADAIEACLSDNREEVTDNVIERLLAAQDYRRPFWRVG